MLPIALLDLRLDSTENTAMNIKARFTHDSLDRSKENEVHLAITLEAPKIEWEKKRQPICVMPVVDVSTSMSGEKLDYAKQSVMKLIDNLQPGDYCGLVAFGSDVYPISKPMEMTQSTKDDLKTKVGKLGAVGCTNFAGGMRQGLEWINAADLSEKYILRVIMFTDGMANQGEAQGRDLIPLCKNLIGKGSVSAFGYGSDCDQELLADLAREGKGNYAFIRNPDDALTAFARELGGLLSRYAQDIVLDVAPFNGHEIAEVVSDVNADEEDKKIKVTLPEILSEEKRHVVFLVKTSEQSKVLPRPLNVVDIKLSYDRVIDGEKQSFTEELKAKIQFVDSGDEQKEPTKEIAEIVGLAKIVQAQIAAEAQANVGNYAAAQGLMFDNAQWCASFNLHDHAIQSKNLAGRMATPTAYVASSGFRSSYKKGATRGVEANDGEAAMNLCALGVECSTSAQDDMVKNFTGDSSGAPDGAGGVSGITSASISVSPGSLGGASWDVVISDPNQALVAEGAKEPEKKAKDKKKAKKKISKTRSRRW
jgi:Ca-activated chloride channel family protein